MTRKERNELFKKYNLTWRRTTPDDWNGMAGHSPHPWWLVTHNLEDGEEVVEIGWHHNGGESRKIAYDLTESSAKRLAERLIKLESTK